MFADVRRRSRERENAIACGSQWNIVERTMLSLTIDPCEMAMFRQKCNLKCSTNVREPCTRTFGTVRNGLDTDWCRFSKCFSNFNQQAPLPAVWRGASSTWLRTWRRRGRRGACTGGQAGAGPNGRAIPAPLGPEERLATWLLSHAATNNRLAARQPPIS